MTDSLTETTSKVEILTEEEVTTATIVDATLNEIKAVIIESNTNIEKYKSNAYYQIGEIILKNIFEGDLKAAKTACDRTSGRNKTEYDRFNKLKSAINKLIDKESEDELPKKTWLYNSVNLVLQEGILKTFLKPDDFNKYQSLSVSHKIELLTLKNIGDKESFILRIHTDKLSVRETRTLVYSKKEKKARVFGLLGYISNPHEIENVNNIKLGDEKKREKAIGKAEEKIKSMQEKIKNERNSLKKLQQLLKKLEEV